MELNKLIPKPQLSKTYILALCLSAQRALAEVPEGEAVAEKSLLDQIMDAVKQPGPEHVNIYAAGLAIVVVILVVFMALKGGSKTEKVTLDDLGDTDKPRKRAGVKRHPDAEPAPKKKKVDEDWEDEVTDSDALYKDLDAAGPFVKNLDGTLEIDSMVKMRKVVAKHAFIAFADRKEELMQERLGYLKQNRMNEYAKTIQKAAQDYGKVNYEITKLAAEWISLDEQNFEASMKQAMTAPGVAEKIKQDDEAARMEIEKMPEDFTREKAKEIFMEKIKAEFDSEKRLANVKPKSQQEAQAIVMVERTKVMDQIFMKHNVRLTALLHANKKYDLENDPDVKAMRNSNLAARQQIIKEQTDKMKAELKVSPEEMEEIKQVCEEKGPVDSEPDVNGQLKFDEYLKVFAIVVTLQIRFSKRLDDETKTERREAAAAKDQRKVAMLGSQMIQKVHKTKQSVTLEVLRALNIEDVLYDKTGRAVKDLPEEGAKMRQIASEIEVAERTKLMGEGYEPLSREDALKNIEGIELKKVQHLAGVIIAQKMGQIPAAQMPIAQELAKVQAMDAQHAETGVEESDIVIAVNKHQLMESDEFKDIVAKAKMHLEQTLQATAQRMQQMQMQMGGMRGMPGGMGRGGGMMGPGGARVMPRPQAPAGPPGGETSAEDLGW